MAHRKETMVFRPGTLYRRLLAGLAAASIGAVVALWSTHLVDPAVTATAANTSPAPLVRTAAPCSHHQRVSATLTPRGAERSRLEVVIARAAPGSNWDVDLTARHGPRLTPVEQEFGLKATADQHGRVVAAISMSWNDATRFTVRAADSSTSSLCRLRLRAAVGR